MGRERHGQSIGHIRSTEYVAWVAMKQRCAANDRYRGRGIAVCKEWADSFLAFLAHVGPRPSASHSLDRIDNDKGYEPGNVRWATLDVQNRNKRTNVMLEFRGRTQCLTDWAAELGIAFNTLAGRLERNWPVEKAFTMPPIPKIARTVCVKCGLKKPKRRGMCKRCFRIETTKVVLSVEG
jgi:hypothetical protein